MLASKPVSSAIRYNIRTSCGAHLPPHLQSAYGESVRSLLREASLYLGEADFCDDEEILESSDGRTLYLGSLVALRDVEEERIARHEARERGEKALMEAGIGFAAWFDVRDDGSIMCVYGVALRDEAPARLALADANADAFMVVGR